MASTPTNPTPIRVSNAQVGTQNAPLAAQVSVSGIPSAPLPLTPTAIRSVR